MADAHLRPVRESDLDALYDICLRTGAAGQDASSLMDDPTLLGDIYAAPYAVLEPEHAFVLDDGRGAAVGYVLGAADTRAFEGRCESEWWPAARRRHPEPPVGDQPLDAVFTGVLHHRRLPPAELLARFPSHLHIDVLPSHQGQGWGRRLMDTVFDALRTAGSPGVHWGVAAANEGGLAFYRHLGHADSWADDVTHVFTAAL